MINSIDKLNSVLKEAKDIIVFTTNANGELIVTHNTSSVLATVLAMKGTNVLRENSLAEMRKQKPDLFTDKEMSEELEQLRRDNLKLKTALELVSKEQLANVP